jgi:endoglucanase
MGDAPEYTIAESWMSRVETVVNWILDEDLYCILNLHHDGGEARKSWIRKLSTNEEKIIKQYEKVWIQIASRFCDFSEKLILESANEIGFDDLWNRKKGSQEKKKAEAFRKLNLLNQTFVDTVRATSSCNKTRHLLVTGYWTDIKNTCEPLFVMPQDTINNKLILSLHYYTPWSFCDGKRLDWGTQDDIDELNRLFDLLKKTFIDNNIPVILGEYATLTIKDNPTREAYRVKWMTAVTQKCLDLNICPILWDIGSQHPRNRIMGDVNREPPFNMSDSLREMLLKTAGTL